MGVKKMLFPIALAIVWVVMAAMAMADFASFNDVTAHRRVAVERPLHSQAQGRSVRLALR
jgi:hypothetical protein